jgi:cholesterol transport system auxiliary component
MRLKLWTAAAGALALSGCFGGAKPPPVLLTLTPAQTRAPAEPRAAVQGHVITVTTPTAPRAVSTNRIPVYVSPTTIQYIRGAQWAEPPTELFRSLLSETLAARTGLVVLDPSVYTQIQGMVLNGRLIAFGLDPSRNVVLVEFDATLTRPEISVATNRFEARVSVADASPTSVAPALDQAANQVAGQVAAWVGR